MERYITQAEQERLDFCDKHIARLQAERAAIRNRVRVRKHRQQHRKQRTAEEMAEYFKALDAAKEAFLRSANGS